MSQLTIEALTAIEQSAVTSLLPVAAAPTAAAVSSGETANHSRFSLDWAELSQKSRQRAASAEEDEAAGSGPAVYDPSSQAPDSSDLRHALMRKNAEVAATQAELENLRKRTEKDQTLQAALAHKRAELRRLQEEAARLQGQVYS